MLPYAVQVKICTAQELQLRFLMRWRAVLCSSDWSVMFVFKHCIFLLLDFIVLRYGHGASVFSDETAWVCHSALSSLLCVGVSEGNVYLINVRACVCVLYLSACTHAFRWPQGLLRVHWTGGGVLISHCGGEWLAGSSHYTFLPTGGAGDPNGSGVTRAKAYIWSSSCLNNRSQLYMWFDVHNPRTLVLKMNKCIKSIVFTQAFQIL